LEDFLEDFYETETDIIHFDKAIYENVIRLEDGHINEIGLILNELDPSVPTLICRKNPDTLGDECVILTPKILDFMKSISPDYLDYDLYINYTIRHGKVKDIEDENEGLLFSDIVYLTEDEFIESEQRLIDYKPTEEEINSANSIMTAIKDFHNHKWHNDEKFWK
jgi:hypothetical protein